ncbi:MFS transporter [Terrabacter sp. MAHUQ-38]|uniref:MFS transporter n=1 Tax=unclassified Terrabacter TaxID=2630222 RepID=UPI00165D309C|nr:MFS transporter [Terrabacter sp. MAHUQ-38]MBC9823175.1 MFS transporter [Terrabacter sp. MAHUQ-38]
MDVRQYQHVLAVRDTRNALALGFLIRVPMFAGTVVLTLHVVSALGRSYGQAGLVTAAATVAIAISGPWRGRMLDRLGLRRTVAPSLVIQLVCWSIAPWVDYAPLMALAALAGLFVVPTFSILRQVIIRSVPEQQRRTALSLDSAGTELSFMAGPALGVWLATTWDTGLALFTVEMAAVVAGCVLWLANPAIKGVPDAVAEPAAGASAQKAGPDPAPVPGAWRGFITLPVAAVYLAAACSTLVLSGTDVAIVAALRSFGATESIGWILALWGAGSLVGGLVYGAWHRSFPVFWLLGGLAATTAPVALAVGVPSFAVLITLSGFLCAPTITATVEQLSRVVPERFRGEMMGWHGSAMTAGSAVGAPVAGFAMDQGGWQLGFLVVSALGVLVATGGTLAGAQRRRAPTAPTEPTEPTDLTDPTEPETPSPASPGRTAPGADSDHGIPAASMEH